MGSEQLADPKPRQKSGEAVEHVSLDQIVPSPLQPRKDFTELDLEELSHSIKENGIIQPLIVRMVDGKYELIAGERRWRASQKAGLDKAPVIVRKATDIDVLELALVENLQRADLNAIEEAEGYARLADQFKLTQEQIAKKVGKSRAAVANALRLRNLGQDIKNMVRHGNLSVGHAKVLLSLSDESQQVSAAKQIISKDLSVRATEGLVKDLLKGTLGKTQGTGKGKKASGAAADWRDLELQIQRKIGTKVKLVGNAEKGHLEIAYFNASELERVLELLGVETD